MAKKYIDADRLKAEIKRQIRLEELNFAALGGGGQTFCINTLEWVLKRIDSLQQDQPSLPFNLDEAAEEYANKEHSDEPCVGRWGTGDYEPPIDREYDREIAKDAFKAGAETIVNQKVSLGYLISWYIQSVDGHQPIWTEEHLKELDKDFILIPKLSNNH